MSARSLHFELLLYMYDVVQKFPRTIYERLYEYIRIKTVFSILLATYLDVRIII